MKKTLIIKGPVGTRSGYGSHSRDIAAALINSNLYDIKIIPTPWGHCPNNALDPHDLNHKLIIERLLFKQLDYVPDIFIQITIPNEFERVGKFNIGITAGMETTIMPHNWIVGGNRMDLVITTCQHSKKVFHDVIYNGKDKHGSFTGVLQLLKPVEVLFEGVDTNIYKKTPEISASIKKYLDDIPEQFNFLCVGQWIQGQLGADRKDLGMLVKVFCDTFKMKPPLTRPGLILKTSGAGFSVTDRNDIIKKLQTIFKEYDGKRPNVYLLHGDLSDLEMNSLYNHSKVKAMVSFTHGEGFGRPLLEFTTTGKPVMTSNWSGPVDFLNENYSVLLPGKLEKVPPTAVNDWILADSQWFTVDYYKSSQYLYDVYANYDKYLEKSKVQMNITNKNFTIDKMQKKLVELIETYTDNHVENRQIEPEKNLNQIQLPKLKRIM